MAKSETSGSSSLEELMESARERELLDGWDLTEDDVRLTVGTYEIELRRQAADRFVRSLLKHYELAVNRVRQ